MTSELLDPRHCVVNNLHKTARAVGRVYAEAMRPAGITRAQFAMLSHLEVDTLTVSELARRLVMDRTTVTRNLRPLERAGLVVRSASPGDARVRLVAITDSGRERLRAARGYWRDAQERMLERFGDAAWRDLEATLRHLRRLVR